MLKSNMLLEPNITCFAVLDYRRRFSATTRGKGSYQTGYVVCSDSFKRINIYLGQLVKLLFVRVNKAGDRFF